MDALTARCGKGPFVACIGLILATGMASPARADSLTLHLKGEPAPARASFPAASPAVEYAPSGQTETAKELAVKQVGVGDLLGLFAAGTVLFGDSPSDFTPPPADNPTPTDLTPPTDITISKDSTDKDVTITGGPTTPEPASLLIGVIGSAFGGIAVWLRRRKKAEAV